MKETMAQRDFKKLWTLCQFHFDSNYLYQMGTGAHYIYVNTK